jgi:outer membrane translocation and assembly module TamA
MRWGVGLGLRLDTPAGPIRLEYAHKINPRPGESAGQWWFAFGMPF